MDPDTPLDAHWITAQQRARALIQQLLSEKGATQKSVAKRLGVSQATVSQNASAKKAPGLDVINGAIERLGIAPSFFWGDAEPGDYKLFQKPDAWMDDEHEDTPGWREFVALKLHEEFKARGLSDRELEYVRHAPGRRGELSIEFYKSLCSVLLGGAAALPEFDRVAAEDRGPDARHLLRPKGDNETNGHQDR